jgi:hypothetical protein
MNPRFSGNAASAVHAIRLGACERSSTAAINVQQKHRCSRWIEPEAGGFD